MILGEIYAAVGAVQKLVTMRMPPKLAYALLRFSHAYDGEYQLIEQKRISLIETIAKVGPGENAELSPGTAEHDEFVAELSTFLDEPSKLAPFAQTLGSMMDELSANDDNALTAQELGTLEPLFAEDA